MGCCLLAAIVIGRWLALWDGLRLRVRRGRAWLLRQPRPVAPAGTAAPAGARLRFGCKARLFVAAELLCLGLLALHEFGPADAARWLHPHAEAAPAASETARCSAPARRKVGQAQPA